VIDLRNFSSPETLPTYTSKDFTAILSLPFPLDFKTAKIFFPVNPANSEHLPPAANCYKTFINDTSGGTHSDHPPFISLIRIMAIKNIKAQGIKIAQDQTRIRFL